MEVKRPKLRPLTIEEILNLPRRETFIKGILGLGEMSVWYGEPGCGKSFLLTDLGLHIAHGWAWFDRKTDRGAVIYIAAEGGGGFGNRIRAFFHQHSAADKNAPFRLIPVNVDLLDPTADTESLISEIELVKTELKIPVHLVVIDTLSRCLVGGSDNAPEDMGAFIVNCDRIRTETGAHVAIIHHSGKDASRGARGHSSLRGAADTEIEIVKTAAGPLAKISKQKDGIEGEILGFDLQTVVLGEDEDGDPITSCIVMPTERPSTRRNTRLTGAQKIALEHLEKAIRDKGEVPPSDKHIPPNTRCVSIETWRENCIKGNISESENPESRTKAFKRASDALQAKGLIGIRNELVWVIRRSD
jgi:hypothetical protein